MKETLEFPEGWKINYPGASRGELPIPEARIAPRSLAIRRIRERKQPPDKKTQHKKHRHFFYGALKSPVYYCFPYSPNSFTKALNLFCSFSFTGLDRS